MTQMLQPWDRGRNCVVRIGTTVTIKTVDGVASYLIEDEANLLEDVISSRSPLARALIGRRAGETVEVAAPRGCRYFVKILSIDPR